LIIAIGSCDFAGPNCSSHPRSSVNVKSIPVRFRKQQLFFPSRVWLPRKYPPCHARSLLCRCCSPELLCRRPWHKAPALCHRFDPTPRGRERLPPPDCPARRAPPYPAVDCLGAPPPRIRIVRNPAGRSRESPSPPSSSGKHYSVRRARKLSRCAQPVAVGDAEAGAHPRNSSAGTSAGRRPHLASTAGGDPGLPAESRRTSWVVEAGTPPVDTSPALAELYPASQNAKTNPSPKTDTRRD